MFLFLLLFTWLLSGERGRDSNSANTVFADDSTLVAGLR